MNVHEVIGWHHCANVNCRRELAADHVVLLTTTHIRRFCSVDCVTEGKQAWDELIFRSVFDEVAIKHALARRIDETRAD